jgi:phage terminase small subunit
MASTINEYARIKYKWRNAQGEEKKKLSDEMAKIMPENLDKTQARAFNRLVHKNIKELIEKETAKQRMSKYHPTDDIIGKTIRVALNYNNATKANDSSDKISYMQTAREINNTIDRSNKQTIPYMQAVNKYISEGKPGDLTEAQTISIDKKLKEIQSLNQAKELINQKGAEVAKMGGDPEKIDTDNEVATLVQELIGTSQIAAQYNSDGQSELVNSLNKLLENLVGGNQIINNTLKKIEEGMAIAQPFVTSND